VEPTEAPVDITLSATDDKSGVADTWWWYGTQATDYARFEETHAFASYSGTWTDSANSQLSGGSYKYTNTTGSSVTLKFSGTAVRYVTTKASVYGIANVSLDGGAAVPVDLYSPATAYQQVVWSATGLDDGPHTLTITRSGNKNPASGERYVGLDAIEVIGSLFDPAETGMTAYAGPISISAEGTTTIRYYSIDNAGNAEEVKVARVEIDGTVPTTTSDAQASYVGAATITLSPSDALSGVVETTYVIDSGEAQTGTQLTVTEPGVHTVDFYSRDAAGNVEPTVHVTFEVLAP
jgi:hypothetical protein